MGLLKEARDKKGIEICPLIDFIEPQLYIFPQLHVEMGAVKSILDVFKGFIKEEVEMLSEAQTQNAKKYLMWVTWTQGRSRRYPITQEEWFELRLFRIESVRINQQEIDDEKQSRSDEQNWLKADASEKRKSFLIAQNEQ